MLSQRFPILCSNNQHIVSTLYNTTAAEFIVAAMCACCLLEHLEHCQKGATVIFCDNVFYHQVIQKPSTT